MINASFGEPEDPRQQDEALKRQKWITSQLPNQAVEIHPYDNLGPKNLVPPKSPEVLCRLPNGDSRLLSRAVGVQIYNHYERASVRIDFDPMPSSMVDFPTRAEAEAFRDEVEIRINEARAHYA